MEGTFSLGLGPDFAIEQVIQEQQQMILEVRSLALHSCCPLCSSPSERAHSQYQRTVADLPCAGLRVTLRLTVRRFFCDNEQCLRQIFTERLPQVLIPHAQMTNRLREALRALSFASSAQTATRLAPCLGMKSSPTTLLRCQKAAIVPPPPDVLKKVGLDDFAFRRGKTWGTIVVNLETHQVVDLLPDRSVPTVVAWLLAHPSIELISRDRGSDSIAAANQGAPQARQVSDRWHILRNLSEYLLTFLARMRASIRKASQALAPPLPEGTSQPLACEMVEPMWKNPRKKRRVPKTVYESNREAKAEQKRDQYQHILDLREQHLTTDEIAARVGIPARTIRRWLNSGVEARPRRRRASPLD
ncbi:MAG: ISL3 family transposase, partial [Chloroflexota bacterium]|nr:ISL3 family transposase [Chloroflexota bacterium]